jgi:hypothetical protein
MLDVMPLRLVANTSGPDGLFRWGSHISHSGLADFTGQAFADGVTATGREHTF